MNQVNYKLNVVNALIFHFLVLVLCVDASYAQGSIALTDSLMKVTVPAGTEKTFAVGVEYLERSGVKQENERIVARLEDWNVRVNGEIETTKFGTTKRSAAKWLSAYSPAEFVMTPGSRQPIRFTLNVPKDAEPGDYYLAVYIENRNPPPPPKEDENKVNYRFQLYTLVFVQVPGLTRDGELIGLNSDVQEGLPVVIAKLRNNGNSHVKGLHSYKILDAASKVVFETKPEVMRAVLAGNELEIPTKLPAPLTAGTYTIVYEVDFATDKPIIVAKTTVTIGENDYLIAKQYLNRESTATDRAATQIKAEIASAKAEKEKTETAASPAAPTKLGSKASVGTSIITTPSASPTQTPAVAPAQTTTAPASVVANELQSTTRKDD